MDGLDLPEPIYRGNKLLTRLFSVKHCKDSGQIWYGTVEILAKLRFLLSAYRGWLKIILAILTQEQLRSEKHVRMLYGMSKGEMEVEIKALLKELSSTKLTYMELLRMIRLGCIAEKFELEEHKISGSESFARYNEAAVKKRRNRVVISPLMLATSSSKEKTQKFNNKKAKKTMEQFVALRFKEEEQKRNATERKRQDMRHEEERKAKEKANEKKRKKEREKSEDEDGQYHPNDDELSTGSDDGEKRKQEEKGRKEETSDDSDDVPLVPKMNLRKKPRSKKGMKKISEEEKKKEVHIPKKNAQPKIREPSPEEMHEFIREELTKGDDGFFAKIQRNVMDEMIDRVEKSDAGEIFDRKLTERILMMVFFFLSFNEFNF